MHLCSPGSGRKKNAHMSKVKNDQGFVHVALSSAFVILVH